MDIQTLCQLTGLPERNVRRAIVQAQEAGGQLQVENNRLRGSDLRLFLATLHHLTGYPPDRRPSVRDTFISLQQRGPSAWALPPEWPELPEEEPAPPPVASPAPAPSLEERLGLEVGRLQEALAALERRLVSLEERFSRVNRALAAIELTLEDDEADNNLYNLLMGHIASFNDRVSAVEGHLRRLTDTLAGSIVKLADDDREIKGLLRELLQHLDRR